MPRISGGARKFPAERQRMILDELGKKGVVTVDGLLLSLRVSESTVRRDLEELSERGLLNRTHGGAVSPTVSTAFENNSAEKKLKFTDEKERIGAEAAKLVANGETLVIDSGSTTFQIAKRLVAHKGLKIVTNDVSVASEVEYDPSCSVMLIGGMYRRNLNIVLGSESENFLRNVRVNKAFLASDAIHIEDGVFNASIEEAYLKRIIVDVAREVILAADRSKFGRTSLARICGFEKIDRVITDKGLDAQQLTGLRQVCGSVVLA